LQNNFSTKLVADGRLGYGSSLTIPNCVDPTLISATVESNDFKFCPQLGFGE